MYCNCFSTTDLSYTIVSFSGGQNKARLQLWKAILFSSATLFILLILHLHIHYELRKIPLPKPPSKASAISAARRKPWPLCFPNEDVGKARIIPAASSGDHRVTEPQNKPSMMQPFLAVNKRKEAIMMNLASFEKIVQNSSVRKYLSYSLQRESCRVAAVEAMWSQHLTQLTELPVSPPISTGPLLLLLWQAGEKKQNQNKTTKHKKKHVLFGELRVAMFVATLAFRNKGVIYWNGEISDFPNTSCGGTGPLLPPYNVPHHFWSSRSCTNATTSGSAHYATNNPHKPLNIYILFKCRISWWSG